MLETGKHYCQSAYIFINEIVQTLPKEIPNEILELHVTFFIHIIRHHLKSALKSSFQPSLLVLLYDFLIPPPLPESHCNMLGFYTTFKAHLVPHSEASLLSPRQRHRCSEEGGSQWEEGS